MDRFGLDVLLAVDDRVDTFVELVRTGLVESIVTAHDAAFMIDRFPADAKRQAVPRWHDRHISQDVIPALLERGLTEPTSPRSWSTTPDGTSSSPRT